MAFPFPVTEALEGRARLLVPDVPRRKGPGAKGPWPFYNPTMAVSRDVSAVVLARWPGPLDRVLDGLAATGAWGIRMALEARARGLVLNDASPMARALLLANVARNGVDAEATSRDLRDLLEGSSFDFVDVDPFGPPVPFLDAALEAARIPSGLGVTATDTAPLSGTYPDVCLRRYGARPYRGPQGHEVGLRILLAFCARLAAAHGKGVRPVLSFSSEHFLRTFLRIVPPMEALDVTRIGHVRVSEAGWREVGASEIGAVGPLWLGPLADPGWAQRLAPSEWTRPGTARLLDLLRTEADLPPFFASTDGLAGRLRASPPRVADLLGALEDFGYRAARTHFDPRGVKTDAPPEDVLRAFRETMPSGPRDG